MAEDGSTVCFITCQIRRIAATVSASSTLITCAASRSSAKLGAPSAPRRPSQDMPRTHENKE